MHDEEMEPLGRRRAQMRTDAEMNQAELAVAAGVSMGVVTRAERGRPINEASLRSIAAVLKVSPGTYADGGVPVPAPAPSR